nr:ribosome production factor 1 [Cryptomonas curvata]
MNKKLSFITAITTSIKPNKKTLYFIQDLLEIIPNSIFFKRKNFKFKEIYLFFKKRGIKNFLVFVEKRKILFELWQINIENDLFFQFKINTAVLKKNLENKGLKTNHMPELMFQNFSGNIGNILALFFLNLFRNAPNFSGRQILFFYLLKNQVFIRYYRYLFSTSGKDVRLQELDLELL